MSTSDPDLKTETELSHVVAEEPSSPHSSTDSPDSPPRPARPHTTAASLIADPLFQAALAQVQRRQDKELEEQRAAMSQVLAHNEQLLARVRTLESAATSVVADGASTFASRTPLPTSYSVGINPALLATPATVRPQLSQPLPFATAAAPHLYNGNPSVARGLFTNPVTNPISDPISKAPPPPPRPYNDEEKGWDKWVQDVKKSIKTEPFKGSTDDERRNIRSWVTSLSMQLDLIAAPRRADGTVDRDRLQQLQARVAVTYLQGGALDWALMYQMQRQADGKPVYWDEMSFALMAKYEGQDHGLLRRQELMTLTYKRGRCTDLPKYEAEFDRLALLVYGSSMQFSAVDELLGQAFSSGIQRGDQQLYESMIPVGSNMPVTLQEWKARAESAMVRAQALRLGSNSTRSSGGQGVTLHNTEATEEHKSTSTAPLSQVSPQPLVDTAQLAQVLAMIMQAQKPKSKWPGQSGKSLSSKKYQLTADERSKLFIAKRCFCCYKSGHPARECSQKATLPTRAPTADELKA